MKTLIPDNRTGVGVYDADGVSSPLNKNSFAIQMLHINGSISISKSRCADDNNERDMV